MSSDLIGNILVIEFLMSFVGLFVMAIYEELEKDK